MGGVFGGKNFQLNCSDWEKFGVSAGQSAEFKRIRLLPEKIMCGPVTGAVENIGYENESDFYLPYLRAAVSAGIGLCVGDGYPDEKLDFGVGAVRTLSAINPGLKAAFFLKPYPDEKLFERIPLVAPYAAFVGIDIDSYNIATMRSLVHLERKTASQLMEFRKRTGLPFVIKGVFTDDDIELVRLVRPDVVYISNHGGRVETRIGSTAEFLVKNSELLRNFCGEIWVDGGIRTPENVRTALFFGADKVIAARPFIKSLFLDGEDGMRRTALALCPDGTEREF